jgi:hypothetical protein
MAESLSDPTDYIFGRIGIHPRMKFEKVAPIKIKIRMKTI